MIQLRIFSASFRMTVVALVIGHAIAVEAGSVRFQFQPLGPLPPNVYNFFFGPSNLSPSGCSIAGDYSLSRLVQGAWTFGAGFVPLEIPATYPDFYRIGLNSAINDNGLIAGRFVWRYDANTHEYRYVQELPSIFSNASSTIVQARAVSNDGSVLAGWSRNDDNHFFGDYAATIWRPENLENPNSLYAAEALLPLAGHNESAIQDMSRDGTVMVGQSWNEEIEGNDQTPVLWVPSASSQAQQLPMPEFPSGGSVSARLSPNGTQIVVTRCAFLGGPSTCRAILATSGSATTPLNMSGIHAVSDNRVVVGETGAERSRNIWAVYLGGNRPLSEILTHAGLTESEAMAWLDGTTFEISADGRTLLGTGVHPSTGEVGLFKIQLPVPGDTDDNEHVNLTDFAALKNSYGQNGTALPTDLDFDTDVDSSDFSILQSNFGERGLPPTLGTCFPG